MPVRAELSQYQELLKMLLFKTGHCAPKIAAINTASEVCGLCAPAFASEIWRLEQLELACHPGFSKYQVALMGQCFFFLISIRPGDVVLIILFPEADLAVANCAVFPWKA